jgi:lipid-binding SYLF domain-containing protein
MKKILVLFIISLALVTSPVHAGTQPDKTKELIARVETCEAILREFMAVPTTAIPHSVLSKARAIIITTQFKAGILLGVQDGNGVILVKRSNGKWSVPALLHTGEASVGLQLGANSIEMIYIITDDETPRLLFKNRINIGADAKAVAGPRYADAESQNKRVFDAPVLVYTKKAGLYAGATIKSGYLTKDDEGNRILYKTNFTLPEIIYSDWITPPAEIQPLIDYVQSICP